MADHGIDAGDEKNSAGSRKSERTDRVGKALLELNARGRTLQQVVGKMNTQS